MLQIETNTKPALFKMLFLIFVSSSEEYEVIKFSISVNVSRYNNKADFLGNDCHDDVLCHLHTHNRVFLLLNTAYIGEEVATYVTTQREKVSAR